MTKIDWSGELEAYHEDGRVVPVTLSNSDPDDGGDYVSNEQFRDGPFQTWYWTPEGFPSPSVNSQEMKWRIRNCQPTDTDRLTRLEAFVARVASDEPGGRDRYRGEAKALVAELNPVDPDVLVAREIIAEAQPLGGEGPAHAKRYRAGDWDTDTCIVKCVEALRQARKEGPVS